MMSLKDDAAERLALSRSDESPGLGLFLGVSGLPSCPSIRGEGTRDGSGDNTLA